MKLELILKTRSIDLLAASSFEQYANERMKRKAMERIVREEKLDPFVALP